MRTLIWSGTALVLLMGAGLFVAAQHATRHPESFVGRCAMSFYRLWNPVTDSCDRPKPDAECAPVAEDHPMISGLIPAGQLTPDLEVVEPIVVDPTDQEPPLAFPRLSPEIRAAIERLRSEEESEAPARPFDDPGQAPRMPYADEETEVLPYPSLKPAAASPEKDVDLPGSHGFFFLPPSCWPTICGKVMESLRQVGNARQGDEESADEGTDDTANASELQLIPYEHYHGQSCPYTGGCPAPYHYRSMPPMAPAPAPNNPPK